MKLRLLLGALLVCAAAHARPGGGQSFSGGGSRSSGGGSRSSSGGGGYRSSGGSSFSSSSGSHTSSSSSSSGNPMPFFIIFGVVIALIVAKQAFGGSNSSWSTGMTPLEQPADPPEASTIPRTVLERLRPIDPEFSNVLFEDFVYMLYAEVHRARAHGFVSIAAFVAPPVAQVLSQSNLADVKGIIIGAMRIATFPDSSFPQIQIELELESNYVEVDKSGKEHRYYAVERMTLQRARTAKSRPPKRARTLDCPNCGAPLSQMRGTQCSYCKQDAGAGRFDWCVDAFRTVSKESRGPLLTSSVEEVGTDFPTVVASEAQARLAAIQQRDPTFSFQAFQGRIQIVYDALQQGWSGRDAARIRPFVSDNLFQSMMYWIDLYLQARCRNMNDGARIQRTELANVISDPHYDAITVRVYGIGADYTISDDGTLLSGSKNQRRYSEYWTLVRGAGPRSGQKESENKDPLGCPNCGAPLKISMVGNCDHCGVKVTSGEFDWVLSRIEQDEVYSG